jgi:hypothetical protein
MTRLPESLRHRLEKAAASNDRSMNAEIIHRLEGSFQRVDQEKLIQKTATSTVDQALSRIDARALAIWTDFARRLDGELKPAAKKPTDKPYSEGQDKEA